MKTTLEISEYQRRLTAWKELTQRVRVRAEALQRARHEEGWKLAASVGIPHCGCSLHNASIDDSLTGWCKNNPERLKVARQANHIVNDWEISHKADRIVRRAWNKLVAVPCGYAVYDLE